jgi:Ca-activated chloride channel homolog
MPRHLTLADIGHGVSRHRERRRSRWLLVLLILALLAGGGLLVPRLVSTPSAGVVASACPNGTTQLVVAASTDKSNLMSTFGAQFSASGKDAHGRCVHVVTVAKASGAGMTALVAGWPGTGPKPDVWSPSGSVWLPLLENELVAAQQSSMIPSPATVPHLATSVMVVAMPRPMAEALGWPDKPIGWADLLTLGSSKAGWAAYGHPEWGQFLLGKTNPNFSHAGLEGTIATYYAAVGRTTGLTVADIGRADTRRFVAGVEQSIVRYGDNTSSFASDWARADAAGQAMSYISGLVTEENLVAAYNQGNPTADPAKVGKNAPPHVPLVAIYPKEGTFLADHPYAVLSAPWVTDAKRDAAAAFLTYLRSPAVQSQWQANNFRDANGHAGPQLTPALGVLPDQPTQVLQPPTADVTNAILDSWGQLRKTANMISLLDVSGSMADKLPGSSLTKLDAAKQAAISSLDLFTDHDEVGLWSFSGGLKGVQDYTEQVPIGPMDGAVGAAVRRDAMATALRGLVATGNTGLYNSIAAAYQAVLARYQPDRINAVVVLTDGKNDAVGGLTLAQLLAMFEQDAGGRSIRVITIAYGPDADVSALAQIARATKGASYVAPTPAQILTVYSNALSNI